MIGDRIERLRVGQLFSVIAEDDAHIGYWARVKNGCRCLVNEDGGDDDELVYPLTSRWGEGHEFRAYSMDESARILAILALTGKPPWVG